MPPVITDYISDRPMTYDPTYIWSRSAQLWGEYPSIVKQSNSRYNTNIVVISIDADGLGVIANA